MYRLQGICGQGNAHAPHQGLWPRQFALAKAVQFLRRATCSLDITMLGCEEYVRHESFLLPVECVARLMGCLSVRPEPTCAGATQR